MQGEKEVKKITKDKSPQWFEKWKKDFENDNGVKPHYEPDFSNESQESGLRRQKLRKQLVNEQGGICCYCMGRINVSNSHIEHFWPKKDFREMDLDYNNLFASCNGNYHDEDYCGHKKEDWWINHMISPAEEDAEKVFVYTEDGRISVKKDDSRADVAQKMIENFGLKSYHLERNRREAIEASEVYDDVEYTDDDIRQFIEFYYEKQDGQYIPYCKAIADCLQRMIL